MICEDFIHFNSLARSRVSLTLRRASLRNIYNVQTWKFISLLCPDIDLIIINWVELFYSRWCSLSSSSAICCRWPHRFSHYRDAHGFERKKKNYSRGDTERWKKSHKQECSCWSNKPLWPDYIHYQSRASLHVCFSYCRALFLAHKYWNMKNAWEWDLFFSLMFESAADFNEKASGVRSCTADWALEIWNLHYSYEAFSRS